jgi:hypothetical protein
MNDMLNIIPLNDLEIHEELSTCKCEPSVIFENGEMIIIHKSFDGRELLENINNPKMKMKLS